MNNDITLSVIVLSYNNEQYIQECLNSIVNQNIDSYEVFIIDDSSTDNSVEVINEFIKNKPQFQLIQKENSGGAISSQIGLSLSRGKYCSIVDSDDIIAEGAYKRLIDRIEKDNSDFAAGLPIKLNQSFMFSYLATPEEVNLFTDNRVLETPIERAEFSYQGFYWNAVYKTQFIKENNIYMPSHLLIADRMFLYKAIIRAKRISVDKEIVYFWRKKNNDEKKSLTDQGTEYHMIADRCDSFVAQMRTILEEYSTTTQMNKQIWENSFSRLYYPLYDLIKDDVNNYDYFIQLCDRYRCLLLEFPAFFEHLVNNSKVPLKAKIVTDKIMLKEYRGLYDILQSNDNYMLLPKQNFNQNTYNAIIKEMCTLTIKDICFDENNIYLSYQIKNAYEYNNIFKLKSVFVNNRYFNTKKTILKHNVNNLSIDISDLDSSTYILRSSGQVGDKNVSYGFYVPKDFSKVIVKENDEKVITFNSYLSMLNIYIKNSFTLLKKNNCYYLYVNKLKKDIQELFFFNIQSNCKIYLKEIKNQLYYIDIDCLPKGTNILLYKNNKGLYNTVSGHEISNNTYQIKKFKSLFNKNRIELEK